MKTKAAVLRNIGGPLMLEDLETPPLAPGQVLIKVMASGLCHSQLNEIAGRKGKEFIPHLMGHEASGQVVEKGSAVNKVAVGDYVVVSWIKGSGLETPQAIYKSQAGAVNAGAAATFTEYAVVCENRLAKLPQEIEPTVAALFGCAVPTGMGIIDQLGDSNGKNLLILGIGGIGSAALLRAIAKGANCLAVDVVDWKLDWAKNNLGVPAINFKEFKKQNFKNFDFVVECSGNKEAMELAFSATADKGQVIIAGNLAPGEKIAIDPFDLIKGKRIKGSWGGDQSLDEAVAVYAPAYLSRQLPLEKLITKTYPFTEINQALIDLRNGKLIRGCLIVS